jgi:hypothetical protein
VFQAHLSRLTGPKVVRWLGESCKALDKLVSLVGRSASLGDFPVAMEPAIRAARIDRLVDLFSLKYVVSIHMRREYTWVSHAISALANNYQTRCALFDMYVALIK